MLGLKSNHVSKSGHWCDRFRSLDAWSDKLCSLDAWRCKLCQHNGCRIRFCSQDPWRKIFRMSGAKQFVDRVHDVIHFTTRMHGVINFMMTSSNGNIFRVTSPLCVEWLIQRSPVNFPHKGQWRGALMFSLICARINGWINNREAGDLRYNHTHYDVIVMSQPWHLT